MKRPSKYDPLGEFLFENSPTKIWMSFLEIEELVGPLPAEARTPQFWANTEHYHSSRRQQWMSHGYKASLSESVDGELGVAFRPVVDMSSLFPEHNQLRRPPSPWTDAELRSCVRAYHRLWSAERAGLKLSKAVVRREVLNGDLTSRSEASYEFRMQNITAVLQELGLEAVKGYPPLQHVGSVKPRIIKFIDELWDCALHDPTSSDIELETRVTSARTKYKRIGLSHPPPGNRIVPKSNGSSERFLRDPNVIGWVLECAAGVCEVCGNPSPFCKDTGEPYLEVHHLRWLSQGGPDTIDNAVACCPTCHRRLHHSSDRQELRNQTLDRMVRLIDHPRRNKADNQ